ncbi:MAG: methyltransferase domain-containing protein [Myxococcaceae bacterium]|nr:methyltransferase domain-containing protein [Myxococcaceae bacterium]
MDWGDGTYELTATALEPATRAALDALGQVAGRTLLDVGCGTGNAALEAARRGARVTGVDPAARLVEVSRARAAEAGLDVAFSVGEGGSMPFPAGAFDDAVSVFAVIFAPDARAVAAEVRRVVKSGGRFVMTAWLPRGPIAESGMVLRKAMMGVMAPPSTPTVIPQWHDAAFVAELFGGARVTTTSNAITFTGASAEAWFGEQEKAHPIWRGARAMLEPMGTWPEVRAQSIAVLQAGNAAKSGFEARSEYVVHVLELA